MQLLTSALWAVAATSACAQRVVPVTIGKPSAGSPPLLRRADWSETLANNLTGGGYYADVEIGTPGQTVTLILDTGSSDVWVLDSKADLCTDKELQDQSGGGCLTTYDKSKSSTYKLVARGDFSIQYADQSGAEGDYIKDTLSIGGANITGLQMGLATTSTINSGLLGIGFSANVAADTPYPNIIDQLESQGLIGIKAYSLYLDDLESSTGTILFGGLDTEKYIGNLQAVPIEPDSRSENYTSFTVALSDLTVTSSNGSTTSIVNSAVPVILDSGTTLTYLPSTYARKLFRTFNAYDDSDNTGLVYISCDYLTSDKSLTFDFQFGGSDGPTIKVPVDELVLDNVKQYIEMGLELPDNLPFNSDNTCSFGVQSSSSYYLLGDTFLRSAYVVYDLTNLQIALAQSNFDSTKSNIVEIQSGATEIPLVSGVASQVTVVQTATGNPNEGTHAPTGTGGSGAGSTVTVTAGASGSSSGNAAPAGVPAPSFELFAVVGISTLFAMLGGALMAF